MDLSTEDEATHGDRAFGQVYSAQADTRNITVLAEVGVLNFDTLIRRLACPVPTSSPARSSAGGAPRHMRPSDPGTAGAEDPGAKAGASTATAPSRKSSARSQGQLGSRSSLGVDQQALLLILDRPALQRPRGVWHQWVGWTWGTVRNTIRTLEALRRRGLVEHDPTLAAQERTPPSETYRLTAAGEAAIQTLRADRQAPDIAEVPCGSGSTPSK